MAVVKMVYLTLYGVNISCVDFSHQHERQLIGEHAGLRLVLRTHYAV